MKTWLLDKWYLSFLAGMLALGLSLSLVLMAFFPAREFPWWMMGAALCLYLWFGGCSWQTRRKWKLMVYFWISSLALLAVSAGLFTFWVR